MSVRSAIASFTAGKTWRATETDGQAQMAIESTKRICRVYTAGEIDVEIACFLFKCLWVVQ